MHVCVHMCVVCVCRPEVDLECLPRLFSVLFIEKGSFTKFSVYGILLVWLATQPVVFMSP